MKRKDITEQENWVVVETSTLIPHHFKTFNEALHSPIKGHVMTEQYYKYHYEKGTPHEHVS
jgi:hypothetical protein